MLPRVNIVLWPSLSAQKNHIISLLSNFLKSLSSILRKLFKITALFKKTVYIVIDAHKTTTTWLSQVPKKILEVELGL